MAVASGDWSWYFLFEFMHIDYISHSAFVLQPLWNSTDEQRMQQENKAKK